MSVSEKVIVTPLKNDETASSVDAEKNLSKDTYNIVPAATTSGSGIASVATGSDEAGLTATADDEVGSGTCDEVPSSEVTEETKSSPDTSEVDSLVLASIESPEKKELVSISSDEEELLLSSPVKSKSGPKHSPIRAPSASPKKALQEKEVEKSPRKSKHLLILPPSPKRDLKDCRRKDRLSESKKSAVAEKSPAKTEKLQEINPKKGTIVSLRKKLPEVKPVPGRKIILKRKASCSSDEPKEGKSKTPEKDEPRTSKSTDDEAAPPKKKYKPITYP